MFLGSFFEPVKTISPDKVRNVIKEQSTDQYCLLDVRQPSEYEQGHIPGARLVPLGELQASLGRMDPGRLTIVYCRSGSRSRSAAGMLKGAGFEKVLNMEGGILAYNGLVAAGPPDAGVFCFPASLAPDQLIAMAWYIEDGSRRYVEKLQNIPQTASITELLARLVEHKRAHRNDLALLHEKMSDTPADKNFPSDVLPKPPADVMAGCVSVSDALNWAADRPLSEILDLMMALEANTLDLYLKLGRQVQSERAKAVFIALSQEESRQLEKLTAAFEKSL